MSFHSIVSVSVWLCHSVSTLKGRAINCLEKKAYTRHKGRHRVPLCPLEPVLNYEIATSQRGRNEKAALLGQVGFLFCFFHFKFRGVKLSILDLLEGIWVKNKPVGFFQETVSIKVDYLMILSSCLLILYRQISEIWPALPME